MNLAQKKQAVIDRISAMSGNEFEEFLLDAPHLAEDLEEGFDCGWDEEEADLDDEIEDEEEEVDEMDPFAEFDEEDDDDDFDDEDNVIPLHRHEWD